MMQRVAILIKREGWRRSLIKVIERAIVMIMAWPFALLIVLLRPYFPIYLIRLFTSRIGHYAMNTELLLCAHELNVFHEKKRSVYLFYVGPAEPICNHQLHLMWKRVIHIIPFPLLCRQIDNYLGRLLGARYHEHAAKKIFESTSGGGDQWGLLHQIKACHLSFSPAEEKKGKQILQTMGIAAGVPFVCLLGRDAAYLRQHLPQIDWSYHCYRDVNIDHYKKAAHYLAEQGYYVVRMGKQVENPFAAKSNKVIDYANSQWRSDFMDVYLTAHCYFMISSSAGLDSIAHIFRRPVLITNIPLCDVKSYYNYWRLFIAKKCIDTRSGELVPLAVLLHALPVSLDRRLIHDIMQEKGWIFVENTADEIVEAVQEMLMLLSADVDSDKDTNPQQKQFWSTLLAHEAQYAVYHGNLRFAADKPLRMGKHFLKNQLGLLAAPL